MLFKLSIKNIKKSIKDYSIYFFTLVVAVSIFYIFNSLNAQNSMMVLTESKMNLIQSLIKMLSYISVFVSIILGFLIIYSNNFLIKRRKKEFGLYLTLGMSKQKVSTILVIETILVGIISLVVGLLLGIILAQFLSIFTARLFEADMTGFKFIISSSAVFKTILYFGIIYLLVMLFNIFAISKYKVIDLLMAGRKNEKVRFRNKYTIFISFVLFIGLYIYAYKLLFSGVLFTMSPKIIYMLISGVLGTFFLFFSLSGIFLKIFQLTKKSYYKNLNMFVLKQINSKVNTTVVSTTIICLMLLLTIGILSGSMSLANVYNRSLEENNLTDFTVKEDSSYIVDENGNYQAMTFKDYFPNLVDNDTFKQNVSDYAIIHYYSDKLTIDNLIDQKTKEDLKNQYGDNLSFDSKINLMKESEYNQVMDLIGKSNLKLDLKDNEYVLTSNIKEAINWLSKLYKNNNKININGYDVIPGSKEIINIAFENFMSSSNEGIVIVSDKVLDNLTSTNISLIGNYNKTMTEEEEGNFIKNISKPEYNFGFRTKIDMQNSSIGIKAIMIFIGLYLGIIFAISSATVLAIGQLSEASDNKNRYKILRQIGADDKMTKKALFTQIAIAFLLPLIVALFHAYFGLREVNGIIKVIGDIDLTSNILLTTMFIVIVYGGYFLATYLASKNIIKEY